MRHITHVDESCHTHEWVMTHMWMSHVTHHTCGGCLSLVNLFFKSSWECIKTIVRWYACIRKPYIRRPPIYERCLTPCYMCVVTYEICLCYKKFWHPTYSDYLFLKDVWHPVICVLWHMKTAFVIRSSDTLFTQTVSFSRIFTLISCTL